MRIEKVVEEFLQLVSQEKVKEAVELVVEEARDREDDVASHLMMFAADLGDEGHHFVALGCFILAREVAKSEDLKKVIIQCLAAAQCNCAALLKEMKRYEEAEFRCKEALRINPEFIEVHYNYAILLKEMKKYEEAEFHYKEALRINPEYAEAHNNYSILLKEMKRYEEAESHCKEALRINPEFIEAHNNYSILLDEMKRYEEAEFHYKEALRINPEDAEAHNNYANLLDEMKRYEEAEFHYKEALRINPEYAEAYINFGILYSDQKKYPEAIECLKKASNIFKEKEMFFNFRKSEAFRFSIKARISWREECWKDTARNLIEAIKNFRACGMEKNAAITFKILNLVAIDWHFIESLTPRDLLDLRDRIQIPYLAIMKFKKDLEGSEIFEHRILAAKFTCIQFLYDALTFQPVSFGDLDNARKVLRDEGFTQAVQSLNVLEIFASDLDQYRSVGLENIPEDEREVLLGKLTSMRYLDGYTTVGTLQDIQKFEPWKKPQTFVEYIDFKIPSKKSVKVGIVQFPFNLKFNDNLGFSPKPEDSHLLKEKFLNYLEIAVKEGLDIVCFPELSMTPDILKTIKEREASNLIIIGGSYYTERMNVCPIVHGKKIRNVQKIHPSKFEFTPVKGKGMIPGDRLSLFDTHAGKFVVLVCEDFRHELYNVLSQVNDLDFIIVISYNPSPERFQSIADPIPPNYPLYILVSNVSEKGSEFGKSCIFGNIDDNYKMDLEKEGLRPNTTFENEVAEIHGEGMLIAEFNIVQKAIVKPTPLDFWTVKDIRKVNLHD